MARMHQESCMNVVLGSTQRQNSLRSEPNSSWTIAEKRRICARCGCDHSQSKTARAYLCSSKVCGSSSSTTLHNAKLGHGFAKSTTQHTLRPSSIPQIPSLMPVQDPQRKKVYLTATTKARSTGAGAGNSACNMCCTMAL